MSHVCSKQAEENNLLTVGVIALHYQEKKAHLKHNFSCPLALALGEENSKAYMQFSLILRSASFRFQNYLQPTLIWRALSSIAKM